MTKENQRIKILEYIGWTELKKINFGALRGTSPSGDKNIVAPNPLTNLNAIHEVVMQQTPEFRQNMLSHLEGIVQNENPWGYESMPRFQIEEKLANATTTQRAEAFLKMIGKWELS